VQIQTIVSVTVITLVLNAVPQFVFQSHQPIQMCALEMEHVSFQTIANVTQITLVLNVPSQIVIQSQQIIQMFVLITVHA
jgi:hypothetical protein